MITKVPLSESNLSIAMDFVRTEAQAHQEAETFCQANPQHNDVRVQQLIYPLDNSHTSSEVYIYSLFPTGFIIVSGDTRAHTILGYSFNNDLDINQKSVWGMIEAYQEQIKSLD
ncbi:streptopain domain-containing protein [Streptococcus pseudoporcinus]|nr:Spi family protease inhibitor [Streptococcus pseudoporcinus]VEF93654.1 streptopain domain-containing protein [Streptococcus pseudoporcinus]